jgi:hypothetical protein
MFTGRTWNLGHHLRKSNAVSAASQVAVGKILPTEEMLVEDEKNHEVIGRAF